MTEDNIPAIAPTHDSGGSLPRSRVFLLVFLPLLGLFLSSARTDLPYHIDAATNVFTAWTIGTTGSPVLSEHAELVDPSMKAVFAWVVPSPRGPISQYPPGAALLAAPLYAIWSDAPDVVLVASNDTEGDIRVTVPIPNLWPAAIVASATTAAALSLLALVVLELGGTVRVAVLAAAIGGLGTGAWTVAADQLWQHGPNMFWVMLGLWLGIRGRWGWAGVAFGALAITRAPVLLVGAALGVALLLRREFRSAFRLAAGVTPGVLALFAYNAWVFGSASVSGGYGEAYAERVAEADLAGYLSNIGSALFHLEYGLFVWSPVVAVVVLATARVVRTAPPLAIAAALGGLAYFLLQLKLNRASGGSGFSYYRYPLEPLIASAPLLSLGWQRLWAIGTVARIALTGTAGLSILVHAIAAW